LDAVGEDNYLFYQSVRVEREMTGWARAADEVGVVSASDYLDRVITA